jgi:hypothetical protein
VKLESSGSGNKWRFQHLTYCLLHPHDRDLCTHAPPPTATGNLSHRCGVSFARHYTCVNPYHLVKEPADANEDREGCRYGNCYQCPHVSKCVFTNSDTGYYRPCVSNEFAPPLNCRAVHDGSCYETGAVVRDDLESFRASDSHTTTIPTSRAEHESSTPEPGSSEAGAIVLEAIQRGESGLGQRRISVDMG